MSGRAAVRVLALVAAAALTLAACSGGETPLSTATPPSASPTTVATAAPTPSSAPTTTPEEPRTTMSPTAETPVEGAVLIEVRGTVLTMTPADNSSVDALRALLADGPLTLTMADYGGMEKVGPIGTSLPTNDTRITTAPGDVILYQGGALVIYYAPNTWSFTRLGRIEGYTGSELRDVLGAGSGDVEVTLSLA